MKRLTLNIIAAFAYAMSSMSSSYADCSATALNALSNECRTYVQSDRYKKLPEVKDRTVIMFDHSTTRIFNPPIPGMSEILGPSFGRGFAHFFPYDGKKVTAFYLHKSPRSLEDPFMNFCKSATGTLVLKTDTPDWNPLRQPSSVGDLDSVNFFGCYETFSKKDLGSESQYYLPRTGTAEWIRSNYCQIEYFQAKHRCELSGLEKALREETAAALESQKQALISAFDEKLRQLRIDLGKEGQN